VNFRKYRIMI